MIQIQIDIMQCILKKLLHAFLDITTKWDKSGGKLDIDNALELYNFPSQINGYQYCIIKKRYMISGG